MAVVGSGTARRVRAGRLRGGLLLPRRCLSVALVLALSTGCTVKTVSHQTVQGDLRQELVPKDGAEPIAATFSFEDGAVVGQVSAATCERRRTWTTSETEVTEKRSNRALGGALVGMGAALVMVGVLEWNKGDEVHCSGYTCEDDEDARLRGGLLWIAGLATSTGGVVMLAGGKSETGRKVLSSQEQHEEQSLPCVPRTRGMRLALQLPDNRNELATGVVDQSGRVVIEVPRDAELPLNREIPVVVVQVPLGAQVLQRGDVVGSVTIPAPDPGNQPADP